MPIRGQTPRSSVKGNRPTTGTREVGELFVNFADLQLGVINTGKVATDLVAVRYFSTASDYAVGSFVVQGGFIYRCKTTVTAGAFNVANWDKQVTIDEVTVFGSNKLDVTAYTAADVLAKMITVDGVGSGLDADLLDGQSGAYYLARANHTGTQAISTVAGLQPALDLKADLASPIFTGNPQAPTQLAGDADQSIATTGFVAAAVTVGVTGLAPLASPSFTGNPTAPTQTAGDSDTSIATTAFVGGAIATAIAPLAPISSPIFTGNPSAPTPPPGDADTSLATTAFVAASYAPLANPIFTGDPRAPTPATADNDTSIATTAYVTAKLALATGVTSISDTPPGSPTVGQLWWNSSNGNLFIYYNDGTSSQFVQINNTGGL
jgi:hypothetical protein